MKNLIRIAFILFITLPITAQVRITGTISEIGSDNTIPFASVFISNSQNSILAYTETDDNGNYTLTIPAEFTGGIFTVSYIGFTTYSEEVALTNVPKTINVSLIPQHKELDEIVVNARRKAVTMKGDKIIFNIDAVGIGVGNNGLETIRLLPGMQLDKDENLIYRGSGNIQIMINGKKSLLTGEALREFIRSLKGSDIESIEIIAQPSSRYEAAGTAGIINIVLKKTRKAGFSGSIYSSAAYGEYFKQSDGGRIFYNDSLWTINSNVSYYNGKSVNHRHIKQNIVVPQGNQIIDQYNEWLPVTQSGSFNLAVERKLGKNHLMSSEWNYYNAAGKEKTNGFTNEYFNENLENTIQLTESMSTPENRLTGNIFYNFISDSATTKLDLQFNVARYKISKNGSLQNDYPNASSMILEGNNKTGYTIINSQADFNHKISAKINLEAGIKYGYVKMKYLNHYTTNNNSLLFIPDSLLINNFFYDENLLSGYIQTSGEFGNWSIQAGLRSEYYTYIANSLVSKVRNKGAYNNVFPSFAANYKKKDGQYQFSYSKRIGRPNYLFLNPYYEYIDAYTVEKGNTDLKPQYYHSFQLSYIYKSALNISLYGYLYKNGFIQVIDYNANENYNITYNANAAKGNRFGFSATLPYQPFKWWMIQLNLDAYTNYEKSDIERFAYNGTGYGYDINLYESIDLPKDWKITLNGFYSGRSATPNGYSRATYDFSLSGSKSMLDKKLKLQVGCNNILKNSFYNHTTQVNNISTDWTNRWETRRFFIQLTYYFGSGNSRKVKAASLDEETKRI